MSHLNVEIKARCADAKRIEDILIQHNARYIGLDHQIDTYFNTPNGRLKLREGNIEKALIFYKRTNQAGPKQSNIILHPVTEGVSLKEILTQTLGVKTIVDKKRRIFFIENVKFHIDEVAGLGSFVEIEAIDLGGQYGYDKLLEKCHLYMRLLEIHEGDLLTHSYSDM
jgi:predicted adenylyl cyclase CyaB